MATTRGRRAAPDLSTIGGRIAAARAAVGLSQEDLARAIGVSYITVNRWENGKILTIGSDNITSLSATLGKSPAWLIDGDSEPSASEPPPLDPEDEENVKAVARRKKLTDAQAERLRAVYRLVGHMSIAGALAVADELLEQRQRAS